MRALVFMTAFAICALPGAAQTVALTFTGSGTSGHGATGSGTGTLTPGGTAAVSFSSTDNGNSNCDDRIQLSVKIQLTSGDTLSLLYLAPNGGNGTTILLNGSLAVTGGTGAYANLGGSGTATITGTQNADKTFTFMFTGTLNLGGPLKPVATVSQGGIVPVFSDRGTVQPGSWISIYGSALANATTQWNGDFPTSLGDVTVSINGKLGYLWFVSATQINVQAPDDTTQGCVPVVVTTPNGTVNLSVDLEPASPSLSLLDNQYVAAVILTPNKTGAYGGGTYDLAGPAGMYSFNTRPVKRGETIELFGVGFGPVTSAVPAGKAFSGASGIKGSATIGLFSKQSSLGVTPLFVGMIGAGLYQINVTIPQNAPTGNVNLNVALFPQGAGPNTQPYATTSQSVNVLIPIQ